MQAYVEFYINTIVFVYRTNDKESFVRKVCLWWGEPFEKPAIYSLARDLKIIVSVVRFHPRPPDLHRSFARDCGVSICTAGAFGMRVPLASCPLSHSHPMPLRACAQCGWPAAPSPFSRAVASRASAAPGAAWCPATACATCAQAFPPVPESVCSWRILSRSSRATPAGWLPM